MKSKLYIFLGGLFLLFSSCTTPETKMLHPVQQLSTQWEFRQADQNKWYPATIPGTVHTDLLANDLISDPFYRTNESDLQWIDKKDWEYRTTLNVSAETLQKDKIELVFKGLDTYADVYVNDKLLLNADNMFRTWNADCKSLLTKGENELRIYFHSPIKIDVPKLKALGYDLPANNDQSESGGLGDQKISVFARKAGYHYGWDWGPRFVTSGIWRPCYLHAWNDARIESIQILTNEMTDDAADMTAVFEIVAENEKSAEVFLNVPQAGIKASAEQSLQSGTNFVKLDFRIDNPELWWSNGLGESYLYDYAAGLKLDGAVAEQQTDHFGVRSLRVVREPDEYGKSFYFELNGVPVFMKGANYIPNDNFLPRVTDEKYERVIKSAADANMNMLRVWGGGIYENDIFYDLCDQYGILVWQDFMFACSMYPGDEHFLQNIKAEAVDNVKRLRNHPSIALWCGNNEIDGAWGHGTDGGWGWKEKFPQDTRDKLWNDYKTIFHGILPDAVTEYDADTFYWWSSPQADENERASYESTSGDVHYWGVWHGLESFDMFKIRIGRFMSEYGFQSFPEFATVKSYTTPEDWDIRSEVMDAHQRSGIGNERIKEYMSWYYQTPKDFESFLYMSHVLQAEGMKAAFEAHRRAMPYCMGTLYWQHNDCWPVASWSSMDYYVRWKALHYFAQDAFNDILVSPSEDDGVLSVWIINDRLQAQSATLELMLNNFDGQVLWAEKLDVEMAGNSAQHYFEKTIAALLDGVDKSQCVLTTRVALAGETVSQNRFYFMPIKDLQLPKAKVNAEIRRAGSEFFIDVSTDKFAKNIYLQAENSTGFFSDNYFDLLPGETVKITFTPDEKITEPELKIMTVADTY